ncbi:MAG TPA: HAD-IA family hydrolase [Candidatus Saccharimonadales bacterium]|nr:HAD-IA family hydrolase [Candidatus Saccharimonadales bacterium]
MKTVIFDFDGTIANSFETLLGLFGEITERQQQLTSAEVKQLRGSSIRQVIKYLKVRPWQIPRLALKAKKLLGSRIKDIKTFPGIPAAIKELRANDYRLYVLSTNSPENIKAFLAANDMKGSFHKIYGDVSLFGKASALKKIRRNERLTGDVIYIGDEQRDIEAARKAGVKIVSVSWGYNFPEILIKAKPDALACTPKDLPDILARL